MWTGLVILTLAGAAVFFAIAKGWIGYMPPVEELAIAMEVFCCAAKLAYFEKATGRI